MTEIRALRDEDEAALLATWNVAHAERPLTRESWRWAWRDNPAGMRSFVATAGGKVRAHYGTRLHRVLVDGEERLFGLVSGALIHPDHRRGIGPPALLVDAARALTEAHCATDKDLVTYCWPDPQGWRREKQVLEAEMVRRESPLERTIEEGSGAPGGSRELPAGVVESADFAGVRELYDRCAAAWAASMVRDETHLAWRVGRHPERPYRVLARRTADGLAGQAILRPTGWPDAGTAAIVDWLVPADDTATGDLLLDGALALARSAGARRLIAVIPPWSDWFQHFQKRGFLVTASSMLLSARNAHPRHDMFWLRDGWWLQPLDLEPA